MNKVSNSNRDLLEEFINILKEHNIKFCVIGGLAVNAYAEPVVSLDIDIVMKAEQIDTIIKIISKKFSISKEAYTINIYSKFSDLRIQLQTDPMYQDFLGNAKIRMVLGYKMPIADVKDVLRGKIWAYQDTERRASKRQKDLADIMRLVEKTPELIKLLPEKLRTQIKLKL